MGRLGENLQHGEQTLHRERQWCMGVEPALHHITLCETFNKLNIWKALDVLNTELLLQELYVVRITRPQPSTFYRGGPSPAGTCHAALRQPRTEKATRDSRNRCSNY